MAPKLSNLELLSLDSAGFQTKFDEGLLTSVELVQACLCQIDRHDQRGAKLNAMISIVPKNILMERSAQLDNERAAGRDAIITPPSLKLATTLGSLALKDSVPPMSSSIVTKLEEMGAIVLGKTNLNEFCNFKGDVNSNGWSAIGGQTQSAYLALNADDTGLGQSVRSHNRPLHRLMLTSFQDPCGSSTGSAVGVSAGYAPLSLGTESIGSIVMPASRAGLYAFKPALNAVSMDGVFKSSAALDVVGGLARSTTDLALLSQTALNEEKRNDLPEEGYLKFLTKNFDSLRVGFLDPTKWSLHPNIVQLDDVILKEMRIKTRATEDSIIYPVDMPPAIDLWYEGQNPIDLILKAYEGKQAVESWLGEIKVPGLTTIEDLIKFNLDNRDVELPEGVYYTPLLSYYANRRFPQAHPDQNQLLKASRDPPAQQVYETVKQRIKLISKDNGIDKLFREQNLNIIAFPMDSLMVFISAASGYPIATMPLGVIPKDGRPYGLGIMAQSGREDLMFQFMSAFEAHFPPRALPFRVQT
ncbi:amidase signature enzyme [Penicillium angulare]|uniref:Amidase signature enzyme n=1 Tax=Penicillium angulare TaxID=116970 RepID=A0A9W9FHS8_9EURO|nr:amidase signature enzyme [Penicillium angulare]